MQGHQLRQYYQGDREEQLLKHAYDKREDKFNKGTYLRTTSKSSNKMSSSV